LYHFDAYFQQLGVSVMKLTVKSSVNAKKLALLIWLTALVTEASNLVALSPSAAHGLLTLIGVATALIGCLMWKDNDHPYIIEVWGWIAELVIAVLILAVGIV
jgi:hypothetical protein